jgi:lysozyme
MSKFAEDYGNAVGKGVKEQMDRQTGMISTILDPTISDPRSIITQIEHHEGVRLKVYLCSAGKLTIGIGHNLDDNGITRRIADFMLIEDINQAIGDLRRKIDGFDMLDDGRMSVLVDMCINLGISKLLEFKKMLAAIEIRDWDRAADEMQDSLWFTQVGQRALTLVGIMRGR